MGSQKSVPAHIWRGYEWCGEIITKPLTSQQGLRSIKTYNNYKLYYIFQAPNRIFFLPSLAHRAVPLVVNTHMSNNINSQLNCF